MFVYFSKLFKLPFGKEGRKVQSSTSTKLNMASQNGHQEGDEGVGHQNGHQEGDEGVGHGHVNGHGLLTL